jgi:hypothetical protein
MQAIKQAAREGDLVKLDALCEEWSVSTAAPGEGASTTAIPAETKEEAVVSPGSTLEPEARKEVEGKVAREAGVEARR